MRPLTILNTVIRQDADGRFCLNDLHRSSGGKPRHQPAMFMRLASTKALAAEIQSADQQSAFVSINGGPMRGTYVCKELVYAYAMWISPAFSLRVIRAYDSIQFNMMGLYQQLQAVIAEEMESKFKATFGSRLMLERKYAIPDFRRRREVLESQLQPPLFIH